MQPTITIDMKDERDLDRALSNLALLTGRGMESVLAQGAFIAARSAAASIKLPSKFRKSTKRKTMFRDAETRRKKGAPWWAIGMVEIWERGVPRTAFFRTLATYNKARLKPRRGLARNVWRASGAQFSQRLRSTADHALSRRYSDTKLEKRFGFTSNIEMSNKLAYIQKQYPFSARIGVHKATKYIEGFAIPRLERKLTRQFYSAAAGIRGL